MIINIIRIRFSKQLIHEILQSKNTPARGIHNIDTVSHTSTLPNHFSSAGGIEEVISKSEVEDYSHRESLRIKALKSRELPVNARFASRCRSTVCSSGEFTIRRK